MGKVVQKTSSGGRRSLTPKLRKQGLGKGVEDDILEGVEEGENGILAEKLAAGRNKLGNMKLKEANLLKSLTMGSLALTQQLL